MEQCLFKMVDAGDAEEKQVVCRFVTKLPDKYRVPEDPIGELHACNLDV